MININDSIFSREEIEEMERASKNLPSEIKITGFVEQPEEKQNYFFHTKYKDAKGNFIKIQNKNKKKIWIDKFWELDEEMESSSYEHTMCIYFDNLPKDIEEIYLYLKRKSKGNFDNCYIKFNSLNCLNFGYNVKDNCETYGIFCGIFSRVSDGWKFYPKMENVYDRDD